MLQRLKLAGVPSPRRCMWSSGAGAVRFLGTQKRPQSTRPVFKASGKTDIRLYTRRATGGQSAPNKAQGSTSTGGGPRKGRKLVKFVAVATGTLGVAYVWDQNFNSATISRSVYALYTFGRVAFEYNRISKYADPDVLHEWASEAIYKMLMKNKGMYIKLGQAIANQGSVFPMAFQKRFAKLYDEAPYDSWESVDKALKAAYGPDYETTVFSRFDKEPVASASIAQVHRAQLKNGDEVAVKVQHDYIAKQVRTDMLTYTAVVKMYAYVFDLPMSFYAKYVADQTILETKFSHELENAERIRKLMADDKAMKGMGIVIPKNYPEYSNDVVLVSEWIDGISLTNKKLLIDSRFNLTTIMSQFIKMFGRQVFKYGFVHCDLHPGNLLVRFHKGQQQLVVLDHGLYVDMPEKFRREYAQLWKHMFAFDRAGIKEIATAWGIKSVDMFATSIQLRPLSSEAAIKTRNKMKSKSQKELLEEFLGDTSKFPLDLFFLGRAMRILQTCNKNLGSPVNRINLLSDAAVDSLIPEADFRHWITLLRLKTTLFISTVVFWWYRLKQVLRGDTYGYKGLGVEDEIEKYFKDIAKDAGFEMADVDEIA